jgi:hypothetical protein
MELKRMNSERDIALQLLSRLLAGERGELPSQLAKLLERSSPLDAGDDFYRLTLPPDLAKVRFSPETRDELIATLCTEIARNPDGTFISAVSFTGMDLPTKTVAMVLINPPRPLTISDYSYALSLVAKFLPDRLAEDPEFLPKADLERLVHVVKSLQDLEAGQDAAERAVLNGTKIIAERFLKELKEVVNGE